MYYIRLLTGYVNPLKKITLILESYVFLILKIIVERGDAKDFSLVLKY